MEPDDADRGVGIEAGLIQLPGSERWLSVQVCAIADRGGESPWGSVQDTSFLKTCKWLCWLEWRCVRRSSEFSACRTTIGSERSTTSPVGASIGSTSRDKPVSWLCSGI
jgi:hypothetical protein